MSFRSPLLAGALALALPMLAQTVFAAACPQSPMAPFVSALDVDSKYDSSDYSRSTLGTVDKQSVAIRDYLGDYAARIVFFADYHDQRAGTSAGRAGLDCMNVWLDRWAAAGAMLSAEATPTGQAVRVWTIASIASAILKVQRREPGAFQMSEQAELWLKRLGERVIEDYEPRFTTKDSKMNNHDYWGAWAVASIDAATGSRSGASYAYRVFEHALQNAAWDARTGTYYLPNEAGRGSLGLHYMQFALTPLAMLAEYLPSLGYTIQYRQSQIMDSLATSALEAFLNKSAYKHLFTTTQQQPTASSFTWARVYRSNNPTHVSAANMMSRYGRYLTENSRIGGELTRVYR
ncbi:alginate lyase family protein [Allohahella sp. A8]|uniref:alginate lyase family protein n=1 Tax=Allohahella sp. A8 TaxID=3141461 RepID=UPI003A80DE69